MQREAYHLTAGSISNIKLVKENLPDPAHDEVTIEVKAVGLNFADIFAIWGLYSATPKGDFIPGLEYAGVVIKTGANVTEVKEGDQVMGVTRFGAYTTHLNIDQRYVIPLPNGWDFIEGAAYLVQVLTAYYGLVNLAAIEKGHNILIHSAAGGVGIWANRIAKQFGANTIGTVGNKSKVEFLKKEGYDKVIVRDGQFKKKLDQALDGQDLNIVMECIGGKIFKAGYERMSPMGRMIVYGSARYASPSDKPNYLRLLYQYFTRPKIDPQEMIELNKAIMGFNLIHIYEKADLMHQLLSELAALDLEKPHVGHSFAFHDLIKAIKLFQTGNTIGKVVLTV